jgi:hypothetical protein
MDTKRLSKRGLFNRDAESCIAADPSVQSETQQDTGTA